MRDALALWRGPAFADLAFESFLQDEIARLDELRLTALEDRIEAEIELGRHDDVIADAASLGSQHPDRERLCRLLMLALHRAGRQQEALDAYEVTRRALDEQWGLEPSPETRALQTMILTQDPAIAHAEPVSHAVGVVRRPVSLLLVEPLLDDELELEAAGAMLEDVRRAVADVVARHGGALSPESGVELVAAFGADGAHEDDVVRAARAAVELREILRGRDVEARFAVGTGRLLVDDVRPVLVGAVVGRTRRALHDADANEIQLTAVAARLGGEAFELDADGRLLGVRPGRPRSDRRQRPAGRADRTSSPGSMRLRPGRRDGPTPACGRRRRGRVGKSRLVEEFAEDVPAVLLEAACIPYGEGISFLPLRELAERARGLDDGAPELASRRARTRRSQPHARSSSTSRPEARSSSSSTTFTGPCRLPRPRRVRRAGGGRPAAHGLGYPARAPRAARRWAEGATVLDSLTWDDAQRLVDALPERDALDEKIANAIIERGRGRASFHGAARGVCGGVGPRRRPDPTNPGCAPRKPHRRARAG